MNSSLGYILLCVLLIVVSVRMLINPESEARRLIRDRKAWGYTHDNDDSMLRKSKRGVIFLYTFILIGTVVMLVRLVYQYVSNSD